MRIKKIATAFTLKCVLREETNQKSIKKFIGFLGFSPLLLPADRANFFNSIEQQLRSPMAKGILMIIFLGLAIFVWKNLDRWKEILMTVLAIAIGSAVFFNAPALANGFLSIF